MTGLYSNKYIFRFNILISFLLLMISWNAQAQTAVSLKRPVPPANSHALTVSFMSWQEILTLSDAFSTIEVPANIFGNIIAYNHQKYFNVRNGTVFEIGFFSGTANQGGAQTDLGYAPTQILCRGFLASYRYAFRLSNAATISFGPHVLFRQLEWPHDPGAGATDAKSGTPINYGALFGLDVRLGKTWSLEQRIASMGVKATTLWSLGLGYKF